MLSSKCYVRQSSEAEERRNCSYSQNTNDCDALSRSFSEFRRRHMNIFSRYSKQFMGEKILVKRT